MPYSSVKEAEEPGDSKKFVRLKVKGRGSAL